MRLGEGLTDPTASSAELRRIPVDRMLLETDATDATEDVTKIDVLRESTTDAMLAREDTALTLVVNTSVIADVAARLEASSIEVVNPEDIEEDAKEDDPALILVSRESVNVAAALKLEANVIPVLSVSFTVELAKEELSNWAAIPVSEGAGATDEMATIEEPSFIEVVNESETKDVAVKDEPSRILVVKESVTELIATKLLERFILVVKLELTVDSALREEVTFIEVDSWSEILDVADALLERFIPVERVLDREETPAMLVTKLTTVVKSELTVEDAERDDDS